MLIASLTSGSDVDVSALMNDSAFRVILSNNIQMHWHTTTEGEDEPEINNSIDGAQNKTMEPVVEKCSCDLVEINRTLVVNMLSTLCNQSVDFLLACSADNSTESPEQAPINGTKSFVPDETDCSCMIKETNYAKTVKVVVDLLTYASKCVNDSCFIATSNGTEILLLQEMIIIVNALVKSSESRTVHTDDKFVTDRNFSSTGNGTSFNIDSSSQFTSSDDHTLNIHILSVMQELTSHLQIMISEQALCEKNCQRINVSIDPWSMNCTFNKCTNDTQNGKISSRIEENISSSCMGLQCAGRFIVSILTMSIYLLVPDFICLCLTFGQHVIGQYGYAIDAWQPFLACYK